jgi:ATP-binding cassette subfamily B multidrug efflux pump
MFRFFENLVDPYCAYPQTDTPPTKLWPFMRAYSQPFKQVFVWAAVTSIIVALVEIGLIYYMGWVVDALSGDPAQVWQNHGAFLIALALFILVLRPGLHVVNVLLMNNTILPNYGTLFRWRAHRHVLRQSVGWFENDFAGRIANRIMQTPPAAGEAVFQVFDAITFSLAYLLGAWVLLAQADLRLSVPLLGWFLLYGVLIRWTIKRVGPASKASSDARSTVTGRVVDAYTNIHSVKMFAQGNEELGYAKTAIEATRQTFQVEMRISTLMEIGLVVLNGLLIVGVVGWAFALWMQGEASIGVVAAATALTLRLNAMTGWIMWALSSFFRQLGVVSEGMETISKPIEMVDIAGAQPLTITEGKIEVQGLSHHYGRQSGGLSDVSFTIQPGEKIGLVGRSGAGKSTLLKLLLRLYDSETGQIMVDGQSVSDVTQDSLRGQIGMVQQEGALLHRSIRDNILYGCADAGDPAMIQAARQAKAQEFILNLQDLEGRSGYDAHVGERGVKLSGGERQRISLARVVLKNAPILLLDEATSALDSEVEAAIQQTLYQMMTGKTVIAIAHRLSTIAQMDRILVMEQGCIVEDGTHADLLAKRGLYAGFWNRQSGGFIDIDLDK